MTDHTTRLREIGRLNGKVERTIRRWLWFKHGGKYKAIIERMRRNG